MADRLDDTELMRRLVAREQSALTELYEQYGAQVYNLTYRVLQDSRLAEEATQDTFMRLWREASRWDSRRGKLSSWLLTIARHIAIDLLRSENRQFRPDTNYLDSVAEPRATRNIPHDPVRLDGYVLRDFMQQIPPEQAQVVEMAFFQGLTHKELAEKLNLPLGTVKTRVRLGLQKLRSMWQETQERETRKNL